jgi:lathosterol oxidase
MLEQKIKEMFGDEDPTGFGTGWWSGVLSAFFGVLAFGAVVCLHFPQLLSSPELRPHYSMAVIRMLIQAVIGAAILLGLVSASLRRKKVLGLTGMLFALAATLLGGASVPINETLREGPAIGLDWFLLDMLLMTLIFSPIEVLWPAYPKQSVFRPEWLLDVVYFLSTHLPIRITSFLILLPSSRASSATRVCRRSWGACPGWCSSSWPSWWLISRNTPSIVPCTCGRSCGASMPSTIPPRRSIGSPVRAPTSWTTSSSEA